MFNKNVNTAFLMKKQAFFWANEGENVRKEIILCSDHAGGNAIMQIRLYRNLWIWNINIARENRFVVFEQQETRKYIYRLLRITRINSLSPFGSSINYPLWRAFSMIRTPKSLLGHRFHTMIVILAIWASLSFHHIFLDDRYGSKGFDRSLKITILYENCLICYKKQNLYYYLTI